MNKIIKLDYSLTDPQERNKLVKQIIAETDPELLTPRYLETLSNYLIFAMDKEEKKAKKILTNNRLITINKRETSYEGLCSKLENGEDGIYNMISDAGKNAILSPKDPITAADVQNNKDLQLLREAISAVEKEYQKASGKNRYLLKKQLIEMRQDQYVIRNGNRSRAFPSASSAVRTLAAADFYDSISFDEKEEPINAGLVSFFNPAHIEALLCNYASLKEESYGNFDHDLWYVMEDLDNLVDAALKDAFPLYYDLLIYKIDGRSNLEIQTLLYQKYKIKHSIEYLSVLWRHKIPKLIADKAKEQYILWYYTYKVKGNWKRCSRCKKIKLAHNRFFSKNNSSKDGWYSLCKECRNARR